MDYMEVTDEMRDERDTVCSTRRGTMVEADRAKKDTTYFMYHMIGMTPYVWQHELFKKLDGGTKRIIACTCRQYLGKTTAAAIWALKSAFFNTLAHSATYDKTRIGFISKTEDQGFKFITDVKEIMQRGDEHVRRATKGKLDKFFTRSIDLRQGVDNNRSTITFKNGCQIRAFPPTDKVRGNTLSALMLDEFAFFPDDDLFFGTFYPTLSKTHGPLLITSTPNGQKGVYFQLFDPFDWNQNHEFERMWLNWKHIESPKDRATIDQIRETYLASGQDRLFEQEYNASFTEAADAFFNSDQVDAAVDLTAVRQKQFDKPCDLGVDFGMANSQTVITISYLDKDNIIHRIYHYVYPRGKETHLLDDIQELMGRFNIRRIIPDDCPEGYHFIQRMEDKGHKRGPKSGGPD